MTLHLINFIFLSSKDDLCQFWPSGSGGKKSNFVNVFLLFRNTYLFEKCVALHLNKLNSLHLRMIYAKLGWNWPSGPEEEIFKFIRCIFTFSWLSPVLKKGVALRLNKLESQRMLCAKFVWIDTVVLEKKMKMWKSLQTDRQTDRRTDRQTTGNQESFQLTWAKLANLMHELNEN